MKKYLFLLAALPLLFAGCSKEEDSFNETIGNGTVENPQEYIVSLGFAGEITDITESPLRTATNDLYGIQVYSSPTTLDDYKPYAYGLFDSKEGMVIKLLGGYKYRFVATMVVDGKNKIYSYNNEYLSPFEGNQGDVALGNSFIYSTDQYFNGLYYGTSFFGVEFYHRPNTERYYGSTSDYIPQNGNVVINMKKVVFGAKFVTENLSEGKLSIKIEEAPEMFIEYPATEVQDIFTFYNLDGYSNNDVWTADDYTETIPVVITWQKNDGASVPLASQSITFKRNTLTTITVKVKDSSSENGVDITEEDTEMQLGDNIVIDATNQ